MENMLCYAHAQFGFVDTGNLCQESYLSSPSRTRLIKHVSHVCTLLDGACLQHKRLSLRSTNNINTTTPTISISMKLDLITWLLSNDPKGQQPHQIQTANVSKAHLPRCAGLSRFMLALFTTWCELLGFGDQTCEALCGDSWRDRWTNYDMSNFIIVENRLPSGYLEYRNVACLLELDTV